MKGKKLKFVVTILCFLAVKLSGQVSEIDHLRTIHSEQEVRTFIERIYTNIDVKPVTISAFNDIRSKNIGESFIDPSFGRRWTLIFDSGATIMNSERNAWNADTSLFFLEKGRGDNYISLALFDGHTAEFIKNISVTNMSKTGSRLPSVRWVPGSNDKLFYLHSNKIYTFCISTGETEIFQEFASFTSTESKIAGGDGNEVAPNGDFLIGNKGYDCFVYNFFEKKIVRIQDNERYYYDPNSPFPTFNLGNIDYAIAFSGFIFELNEDGGGTQIRDYNGSVKQKLYRRTPHMDPTFFNHNGKLYPGIDVRYNAADVSYYNNLSLYSQEKRSYFHAFNPDDPTELIRLDMDFWPSTNLGSGGQVSSNRFDGTTGILSTHGPALYDLDWEARFGEVYEKSFNDYGAELSRRIAHHYIGYEVDYPSSSYQPEGWQSPDGSFVIIKSYWGWYKVDLTGQKLLKTEVDDYLNSPSPTTYSLNVVDGKGSAECIQGVIRTINANKITGMEFDQWIGDTAYIENKYSPETKLIMPSSDITLTATFKVAEKIALQINIKGSGSVLLTPNDSSFYIGTPVALTAIPDEGVDFIKWTGDLNNSQNPSIVIMDSAITIEAVFSDGDYTAIKDENSNENLDFFVLDNPIKDNFQLNIKSPIDSDYAISIYATNGQCIYQTYNSYLHTGLNSVCIDVGIFNSPGVYMAVLSVGRSVRVLKFIKN